MVMKEITYFQHSVVVQLGGGRRIESTVFPGRKHFKVLYITEERVEHECYSLSEELH